MRYNTYLLHVPSRPSVIKVVEEKLEEVRSDPVDTVSSISIELPASTEVGEARLVWVVKHVEKDVRQSDQITESAVVDAEIAEFDIVLGRPSEKAKAARQEMEVSSSKETQSTDGDLHPEPMPRSQTPELVKALGTAAMHGFTDIVVLLLECGVDIDAYDEECTALLRAVEGRQIDTVESLLEHDANPNLPRKKGSSPLLAAAYRNQLKIVRMLLAKGADAKEPGLLFKAVHGFDAEMLVYLVDAGADINAMHDGNPKISAAISCRRVDVVEGLLQRGASPAMQGKIRYSPLADAAARNMPEMVQLLLKYGQRRK